MRTFRFHFHLSSAVVVALAAGSLLWMANPGAAVAGCWKNDVAVCDIIARYDVTYNGGSCGGSYDVSFTLKNSSGSCGAAEVNLWGVRSYARWAGSWLVRPEEAGGR